MLLDSQNLFSLNQTINSGVNDSTYTIKFGKGDVSYLPIHMQPLADFINTQSIVVKFITAVDEEFTEPVELAQFSVAKEDLVAGKAFPVAHLPKGNLGYMKLTYTATLDDGAEAETQGKILAGIVPAIDTVYEE